MTAAFREFTGKTLNKTKKPSVRKKLQQAIAARSQDKQREREKSKETKFSIAYKGELPYIKRVEYFYDVADEDELNAITVRFDKGYENEVKNFLSERYLPVPINAYVINFYTHYETLAAVKVVCPIEKRRSYSNMGIIRNKLNNEPYETFYSFAAAALMFP